MRKGGFFPARHGDRNVAARRARGLRDVQPLNDVSALPFVTIQGRVEGQRAEPDPRREKADFAVARRSHRLLPPAPLGTLGVTETLQ